MCTREFRLSPFCDDHLAPRAYALPLWRGCLQETDSPVSGVAWAWHDVPSHPLTEIIDIERCDPFTGSSAPSRDLTPCDARVDRPASFPASTTPRHTRMCWVLPRTRTPAARRSALPTHVPYFRAPRASAHRVDMCACAQITKWMVRVDRGRQFIGRTQRAERVSCG